WRAPGHGSSLFPSRFFTTPRGRYVIPRYVGNVGVAERTGIGARPVYHAGPRVAFRAVDDGERTGNWKDQGAGGPAEAWDRSPGVPTCCGANRSRRSWIRLSSPCAATFRANTS